VLCARTHAVVAPFSLALAEPIEFTKTGSKRTARKNDVATQIWMWMHLFCAFLFLQGERQDGIAHLPVRARARSFDVFIPGTFFLQPRSSSPLRI
jgi:hypothetical protein